MTRSEVLKTLNMTQQGLAKRLGIGRTTVTMWGKSRPIPRGMQFEIAYRFPDSGLVPESRYLGGGDTA